MLNLRTSSTANVGSDKDSDRRSARPSRRLPRRTAIAFEFYDAAMSGADPATERPGFKAMLDRIAGNGVRVILVESPDRFARYLAVMMPPCADIAGLVLEPPAWHEATLTQPHGRVVAAVLECCNRRERGIGQARPLNSGATRSISAIPIGVPPKR